MLLTLLASAITLSVIVFIHEFGHFAAAKISNVRVDRFSMGFGPVLLGVSWGETEYCISAIPFGGYVRMEGEDPEEAERRAAELAEHGRGAAPEEDRGFLSKGKATRAFIIVAGPAMNFLLAVLIYAGLVAHMGIGVVTTRQVGGVLAGTPAMEAGVAPGDLVVSVGGVEVETWDQMLDLMAEKLGTVTEIVVERDRRPLALSLDLSKAESLYDLGMYDYRPPIVGEVKLGGPAAEAGLQSGDRIVRVAGKDIDSWSSLSDAIGGSPNKEIKIEWERSGETHSSVITPIDLKGVGKIEIYGAVEKRKVGPGEALKRGLDTTLWMA
ncbi:MAG: RIP metalloprotease RseP, partial [bacterium]